MSACARAVSKHDCTTATHTRQNHGKCMQHNVPGHAGWPCPCRPVREVTPTTVCAACCTWAQHTRHAHTQLRTSTNRYSGRSHIPQLHIRTHKAHASVLYLGTEGGEGGLVLVGLCEGCQQTCTHNYMCSALYLCTQGGYFLVGLGEGGLAIIGLARGVTWCAFATVCAVYYTWARGAATSLLACEGG